MNANPIKVAPVFLKTAKQILLLVISWQLIRLVFFLINRRYLDIHSACDYLQVFFYSLRFDLSSIFILNLPFIFLALLPVNVASAVWYRKTLNTIFLLSNGIAILFELSDIAYFPYVRKRMTADVFSLMEKKSDFLDLLPEYLQRFWFVLVLAIIGIALFVWIFRRISPKQAESRFSYTHLAGFILAVLLSIIAGRGGLQLRPITMSSAHALLPGENSILVLNTTFSILKSAGVETIEEYHFFDKATLKNYYNPIKNYANHHYHRKPNIVLFVLESFGKSYTGMGGRRSCTPFLDSLSRYALVCSNTYANAFRSADGIPAIFSGLPFLVDELYEETPYAGNSPDALPQLLQRYGYSTSFFHGGSNGTMGFDTYARNTGFQKYFGRNEYGNDEDYDGTWGIWDEPFLQYTALQLDMHQQPFFAGIFTLSSHEPFKTPANYNAGDPSLSGIEKGVMYTDHALRSFFKRIEKTPWYPNTLFVITADHNYLACRDSLGFYNRGMGLFSIPLWLYHPGDSSLRGQHHTLVQQLDIMPSILDYAGYPDDFFAYGSSIFDSSAARFCYTHINNEHYMLLPPYLLTALKDEVYGLYHFEKDSLMKENLLGNTDSVVLGGLVNRYHAFLQLLHYTVLKNEQSASTFKK